MTANQNRSIKGQAIDKLNYLGFSRVYASDSGENIVIVTTTPDGIKKLCTMFCGVGIRGTDTALISFGKRNREALGLIG